MCATSVSFLERRQVDLNAPLSKDSPPVVTNATRLRAACPTINLLAEKGAKVILASHLGRPKKQVVDGLRMDPVAVKLSELLGKEVRVVGRVGGERVEGLGSRIKRGGGGQQQIAYAGSCLRLFIGGAPLHRVVVLTA